MGKTHQVATSLLAPGKGILVADEYVGVMLGSRGSDKSTASLSRYVDLAVSAPGLGDWVSGVVLTTETFAASGSRLTAGQHMDRSPAVQIGARMDAALARLMAGDRPRPGVDDARRQLAVNRSAGATFAEWRANLDPASVESGRSHADAEALALGVAASQSEDVLPMVTVAMPDLTSHSAAVTQAATGNALRDLFGELARLRVDTSAMLLRVNMVVAGDRNPMQAPPDEVARATLAVISATVPDDVPGVVFLGGRQRLDRACANLSAITSLARQEHSPWRFSFAFARTLITRSLAAWRADAPDAVVQSALVESCRRASQSLSSSVPASSV